MMLSMHMTHAGLGILVMSAQKSGAMPFTPHAAWQAEASGHAQLFVTVVANASYAPGFTVSQHFAQVVSDAEGGRHAAQSDASAQVSPPPVDDDDVVPVPVAIDPVVVVDPVVIPPLPMPPLPPALSPVVVPVEVPFAPHPAATANIETTIAPNVQDFMLISPNDS